MLNRGRKIWGNVAEEISRTFRLPISILLRCFAQGRISLEKVNTALLNTVYKDKHEKVNKHNSFDVILQCHLTAPGSLVRSYALGFYQRGITFYLMGFV